MRIDLFDVVLGLLVCGLVVISVDFLVFIFSTVEYYNGLVSELRLVLENASSGPDAVFEEDNMRCECERVGDDLNCVCVFKPVVEEVILA